jgi:hypothetical protein
MLAFRGEAHIDRWCEQRRIAKGDVLTLDQAWQLGRAWYEEKLSPEWKRATPEEAETAFAAIGLTGDFWRLR